MPTFASPKSFGPAAFPTMPPGSASIHVVFLLFVLLAPPNPFGAAGSHDKSLGAKERHKTLDEKKSDSTSIDNYFVWTVGPHCCFKEVMMMLSMPMTATFLVIYLSSHVMQCVQWNMRKEGSFVLSVSVRSSLMPMMRLPSMMRAKIMMSDA